MIYARKIMLVMALVLVGTLAGCRSVQVTFENTTSEPLALEVNGPGSGTGQLGTIPPRGQIRTLIEVCEWDLPTTYTFTAGDHAGAFSISSDSHSRIWVTVPEGSKGIDPQHRHAEGSGQTGKTPVIFRP